MSQALSPSGDHSYHLLPAAPSVAVLVFLEAGACTDKNAHSFPPKTRMGAWGGGVTG